MTPPACAGLAVIHHQTQVTGVVDAALVYQSALRLVHAFAGVKLRRQRGRARTAGKLGCCQAQRVLGVEAHAVEQQRQVCVIRKLDAHSNVDVVLGCAAVVAPAVGSEAAGAEKVIETSAAARRLRGAPHLQAIAA
jgi:hypothetical protein